ncbi:unnamed protein product [Brachionus calyciflorus]|uniref:Uncharacterized protein n=1 Tax=Brachionus calyciflorus TaxID=104777 RepID=A0A813M6T4_9BILA|nr:unnamed protein product [Brachionus calyciflorus]
MSDSSSNLLNGLFSTTTENPLEVIKRQQEQIQRQLLQQELLNNNLYQSLLNSGLIQNGKSQFQLTSTTTQSSLLNLLQNRNLLSGLSGSGETTASPIISNSLSSLASIFPLGDAISGLGSVFEKLFGTKFWIYAFLIITIGICFIIVSCFCIYCCCCNSFGRNLCKCCCMLSKIKKSTKSSSSKKKKKELENDGKKSKLCI